MTKQQKIAYSVIGAAILYLMLRSKSASASELTTKTTAALPAVKTNGSTDAPGFFSSLLGSLLNSPASGAEGNGDHPGEVIETPDALSETPTDEPSLMPPVDDTHSYIQPVTLPISSTVFADTPVVTPSAAIAEGPQTFLTQPAPIQSSAVVGSYVPGGSPVYLLPNPSGGAEMYGYDSSLPPDAPGNQLALQLAGYMG